MFHLYGLFIGIAIVVGYSVAEKLEPRVNKVAPWVLTLGIVGARIYHLIDFADYYSLHLNQVIAVWNGGLSIWGGLIGGIIGLLIGMWQYKIQWQDIWGIVGAIVSGLPLAQAIGRLGNAVNGEFTEKVWMLPWWAVEAILDLILFAVLRGRTPKWKIFIYLSGYLIIRLILNPYRVDLR